MNDPDDESSHNWFNMTNPFKRNELDSSQKGISAVNPSFFKESIISHSHNSSQNLQKCAQEFVNSLKQANASRRENEKRDLHHQGGEVKKQKWNTHSNTSMWEPYVSSASDTSYSPSKLQKASMSRLLNSKSTLTKSSPFSFVTPVKSTEKSASIASYWKEKTEKCSDTTLPNSNPLQYYQQQSNYLEGGITITGKAPSKTQQKSNRKELAVERKNLMHEVKDQHSSSSKKNEKTSSVKKTTSESSKGRKRRRELSGKEKLCWSHLRVFLKKAHVLQGNRLDSIVASLQSTYGETLTETRNLYDIQKACKAACVFCCILNDSSNTFQSFQTVHADIANHTFPIAFYFTLYLSEGESSFIVPLSEDESDWGDSGLSRNSIDQTFSFFKVFFSLPRLLKITFGLQRLLRLLDLFYLRYHRSHLLTPYLCSQSCMDTQLLTWVMDSDNQGVLRERLNSATSNEPKDTSDHDSPSIQIMSQNYKAVWRIVGGGVLNPKDIWSNQEPEAFLESLLISLKQMHDSLLQAASPSELCSYLNIEMRLLPLLARMEVSGILVTESALQNSKRAIKPLLKEVEEKAEKAVGHPVLLTSPKQVCEVIFDELKLGSPKMQRSTVERVLQALTKKHAFPGLVIQHRRLSKLMTSYIDGIQKELISPSLLPGGSKYVFTTWNQMATGTGRLSTTAPNVQTLPKRSISKLGGIDVDIRGAFVAEPHRKFISVDYRQIEMRVFAHFSNDPALVSLFASQQNSDVYSLIASILYDIDVKDVTEKYRDEAKVITLGLCYGMGVESMAEKLDITVSKATQLKDTILTKFKGIRKFMSKTIQSAHKIHYVETMSGRRRYLKEDKTDKEGQGRINRQAVNSVIQGSAADLLKCAMILLWKPLEDLGCRIALQIHDELIIDCPDDTTICVTVVKLLERVMCVESKELLQELWNLNHTNNKRSFEVPLEQSVTIGRNMSFKE